MGEVAEFEHHDVNEIINEFIMKIDKLMADADVDTNYSSTTALFMNKIMLYLRTTMLTKYAMDYIEKMVYMTMTTSAIDAVNSMNKYAGMTSKKR